jgi:uncharacterized membrane protein
MALGELVVGKLPSTPERTQPVGVAARAARAARVARVTRDALSGAAWAGAAWAGTALAGGRLVTAALAGAAGAAGAVVTTHIGHAIRTRVPRAIGNDGAVAAAEDLLAFGGAAMVCVASLAPEAGTTKD